MSALTSRVFAVVPAAGVGSRMQADRPKQYLSLHDQTIMEHTLHQLLAFTPIEKIILPISNGDEYWPDISLNGHPKIVSCEGGSERFESVLNGLNKLLECDAKDDDWVMVHDVARPCIQHEDLQKLINNACEQGAILGAQVRDTMKRTNEKGEIVTTVEREYLWHALTPQLAPIGILKNAIETAIKDGVSITDEASALEHVGLTPKMVAGAPSNIKVTRPEDLSLAAMYLSNQS
jgi:2-C-methyl-D-erythritol 4-phosphate cytidylyltransferase